MSLKTGENRKLRSDVGLLYYVDIEASNQFAMIFDGRSMDFSIGGFR
jgi:hypothetical protein